jgi:hypothetical protein
LEVQVKTILLLALALAQAPLWAQSQPCTLQNATLKGAYLSSFTGTAGGAVFNNSTGPFAAVGRIVYDGLGNLQATFTSSIVGFIVQGDSFVGTYTVNPDCTGSMTFTNPPMESPAFDIVIRPHGRQVTIIQTNTGTTITGTAVRLDRDDN